MQTVLIAIAAVAFVLGVMIIVHEFGHFAAAKLFGVRVETFSVGFGKRLLGFRRGDTDYRLSLIPLGGYVKMSGENFMEERTGEPYEFMSHPRWQRFVIAIAGPFMNILLAVALLTGVFMVRYEHPLYLDRPAIIGSVMENSPAEKAGFQPEDRIVKIEDVTNPVWEDVLMKVLISPNQPLNVRINRNGQLLDKVIVPRSVGPDKAGGDTGWIPEQPNLITAVQPETPAARAGLKVGDEIASINGKETRTIEDMIRILQGNKDKPIDIIAMRDGRPIKFTLTPMLDKGSNGAAQYRIGIVSNPMRVDKLPFKKAVRRSIDENRKDAMLVVDLIRRIAHGKASIKQVSGPIGIGKVAGEAAQEPGWSPLIGLMAMVSLQLGLFNLLPFPILDGGLILMLFIEAMRGRDISLAVKERVYQVAFVLLVAFAVVVIFNDLTKL